MKNIFKVLFVSILGVILVACGGPKNDYNLEGKYSINKVEYLKENIPGTEIKKVDSNIEITRKGNIYTIKGTQLKMLRDYTRDFITKEVKFDNWRETTNRFVFTGKIIKEANKEDTNDILKHKKLYAWDLADDKGNTISIMIYKDSKVKEAIESEITHFNHLKGAIYKGKNINDVISLVFNDDFIIIAIKES